MKFKVEDYTADDENITTRITSENNDIEYRMVINPPEWTKEEPSLTINIKSYDSKRVVKKKSKKA
jgi:hypothetical protein